MSKRALLLLFLLLLQACGPVYRTRYTYYPPENESGRACVFQCENSKLQCEQIQDMERDRCLDRAERDYDRCEDRNRYKREDKKDYCYRSYCAAANYERCESRYRTCYQSCGGMVRGEDVCVSFCDKK